MKNTSLTVLFLGMLPLSCGGPAFTVQQHERVNGDAQAPLPGPDGGTGGRPSGLPTGGSGAVLATGGARGDAAGGAGSGGVLGSGGAPTGMGGSGANDSGGLDAGRTCITDLSGVGTGDFRIAFTLTTTGRTALVNQRAGCDQTSAWWQALVDSGGGIIFNMCDGSGACSTVRADEVVNDGASHRIVLVRRAGAILISIDGTSSVAVPDAYSFGTFGAPLRIGTDACGDTPLAGHGTLTDLCLSTL